MRQEEDFVQDKGAYSQLGTVVLRAFAFFVVLCIWGIATHTAMFAQAGTARSGEECTSGWLELSEHKALHYLHNKNPQPTQVRTVFLLVHGASKEHQNARHWEPHLSFFSGLGQVYAVDMLGHGESRPGSNDKEKIGTPEQLDALEKLIKQEIGLSDAEGHSKKLQLILIGRSYGGGVVLKLAKRLGGHQKVQGLVLIAPAVQDELVRDLPQDVLNIPTLFFWAKDDPFIAYTRYEGVCKNAFTRSSLQLWDQVAPPHESWRGHTPELVKVEEFQTKLRSWLQNNVNLDT
jgi:pimeloyl-ACP methyl ester carboxylesterase